jgi:hypothetical protein
MKITNISIKADLDSIPDIKNSWCDAFVTSDDGRIYILQIITYTNFLNSEQENNSKFLSPMAPMIIVEELKKEVIEAAIHYYAKHDNGYWLKFCHMGTEIDEKTLNILTDRWFARDNLIDFTATNEFNLIVEKLKSELKEELLIELKTKTKTENSTSELGAGDYNEAIK